MSEGFKNKTVLHRFRKVNCYQGFTPGTLYQVDKVLRLLTGTTVSGLVVLFEWFLCDVAFQF